MEKEPQQHQVEIESNRDAWARKAVLREIYAGFYREIVAHIDGAISGRVLELGSGMGNLREHYRSALGSDLFANPWLDLACSAYALPFRKGALSHLILFDVFHHLERPRAFLAEARRVLPERGRVILFEPFISLASWPAYGLFHHEPVAWREGIDLSAEPPENRYYAAQGNATRLFFRSKVSLPEGWELIERRAQASFAYLLSGGFSKPAMYPAGLFPAIRRIDGALSRWPNWFGARALVVLRKIGD